VAILAQSEVLLWACNRSLTMQQFNGDATENRKTILLRGTSFCIRLEFIQLVLISLQLRPAFLDETSVLLALRLLRFSDGLWLFGAEQIMTRPGVNGVHGVSTCADEADAADGNPDLLRHLGDDWGYRSVVVNAFVITNAIIVVKHIVPEIVATVVCIIFQNGVR